MPAKKHEHQYRTFVTGGQHFTQGEPWDDFKEETICTICGQQMPEEPRTEDIGELEDYIFNPKKEGVK